MTKILKKPATKKAEESNTETVSETVVTAPQASEQLTTPETTPETTSEVETVSEKSPEKAAKPSKTIAKKPERKTVPKKEKEVKVKAEPTLIDGMGYGLISRVRNAFPVIDRMEAEKGHKTIEMVDGRGKTHEISEAFVIHAKELGGADYLKTVRSSAVKARLRQEGKLASLAAPVKKAISKEEPKEEKGV
jgi:hypothetical protein